MERLNKKARAVRLPPRAPANSSRYLAVTAIIKNEGRHLREWVEFQRLMGAEHIYLYDNGSTDDSLDVVTPFVGEGFVTLLPWATFDDAVSPQRQAYAHALCNFGHDFRWMAFIDLDEFLFPVTAPTLIEVLSDYEEFPCLCVPWFLFGFSGHAKPPLGPVIENYTQRAPFPPTAHHELLVRWKSIVNPAAVSSIHDPHMFELTSGVIGGIDERRYAVSVGSVQDPPPGAALRINHYFTRSRQEFVAKSLRMDGGLVSPGKRQRRADLIEAETVRDDAILRFLPALRERMKFKPSEELG